MRGETYRALVLGKYLRHICWCCCKELVHPTHLWKKCCRLALAQCVSVVLMALTRTPLRAPMRAALRDGPPTVIHPTSACARGSSVRWRGVVAGPRCPCTTIWTWPASPRPWLGAPVARVVTGVCDCVGARVYVCMCVFVEGARLTVEDGPRVSWFSLFCTPVVEGGQEGRRDFAPRGLFPLSPAA